MKFKDLYTLDWSEISSHIQVSEYLVPIPRMPHFSDMRNFGKPIAEQKFERTVLPENLMKRKPTSEEEDRLILREYHKYDNGEWILVKGQPIYLWGDYYHFLNEWHVEDGTFPYFYQPQQRLYCLYNWLDMDDSCLGTALFKGRRMRATEITIHRGYFKMFRNRNKTMFMQSKNEDTVLGNYNRILNAHDKMRWYVKPINRGSTKNQEGLFLEYPSTQNTHRALKEKAATGADEETIFEDPEIGSKILYGPCKVLHFDGKKAFYAILNEFAKLENMSLTKVVSVLRQCVTMNSLKTKVGMLHLESTVEEMSDAQLQEVIEMWNDSDPAHRNRNGRTTSGIFRIFISAAASGEPDEWGLVDEEATRIYIQNTIEDLVRKGKIKEAAQERRLMPLTIEDALTPSGEASAFNKEKLQETLDRLTFPEKGTPEPTERGDFEWENGIQDTRVVFLQNPEGRFEVTKLMGFRDNYVIEARATKLPGNNDIHRAGIDPYDHKETSDNRKSKGAAVLFEKYKELVDGKKWEIESGVKRPKLGGLEFETNQPICTYLYRRDDPDDFYEDMIKMLVYYGAPALPESNKPGIIKYFDKRGYGNFIMNRPAETETRKDAAYKPGGPGIAASDPTIEQYFSALASYIYNYNNAIKFKVLLIQLLAMNRKNITKHDLGVAFGWCLLAVNAKMPTYADRYGEQTQQEEMFEYYNN